MNFKNEGKKKRRKIKLNSKVSDAFECTNVDEE